MEITKEMLEERLKVYEKDLEGLKQQMDQIKANINAYEGAVQDVKYWLEKFESADESEIASLRL
jgi:prefoldin subunit 5